MHPFLKFLAELQSDPSHYEQEYKSISQDLGSKHPYLDEYQLDYWTNRIISYTYGNPGTYTLTIVNPDEPQSITLTIQCDYPS